MKHNPIVTANATASTIAAVYLVCGLLVVLFGDLTMTVTKSWFHGIDISRISSWDLTAGTFLMGLVTASVFFWLAGFLFGWFFEFFDRK